MFSKKYIYIIERINNNKYRYILIINYKKLELPVNFKNFLEEYRIEN